MKIRIQSIGKQMGWKYCLFNDYFCIEKFWGGKIIQIGFALIHVVIDLRKNWIKDMMGVNND